jgi:hypothetical protein
LSEPIEDSAVNLLVAVSIRLMNDYLTAVMEPFITLLEIHKLMYFMQEAGEHCGYLAEPSGSGGGFGALSWSAAQLWRGPSTLHLKD